MDRPRLHRPDPDRVADRPRRRGLARRARRTPSPTDRGRPSRTQVHRRPGAWSASTRASTRLSIASPAITTSGWRPTAGAALQRRKLRLAGLQQRFARVLVSSEIWYLKTQRDFAALIHSFSRNGTSSSRRRVTAVIGAGDADLVLAANGGWPAVHICGVPNSSCGSALAGHAGLRHVAAFAALTYDPLRPADAPAAAPPHRA